MTAILTITEAGTEREQEALAPGGPPLPKIERFLIGAGPVQENPLAATDMTAWHEAPVFSVEKLSKNARQYTCHLGPEVEGPVREIGLIMDDGTLYAYGAWQPDRDGDFKPAGTAYTLYALIARENLTDLEVKYAPLDIDALTQKVSDAANARISAESGAFQVAVIRNESATNRVAFEQQKQINTLEARK